MIPKSIPIKDFWLAIRTSDVARLEILCEGVELPTFDDKGHENHLLAKAMSQGADTQVLQFLVERGVNPQALPVKGYHSPLEAAVFVGKLEYLDFVLGQGVDPNNGLLNHRVTLTAAGSRHQPGTQLELLSRLIAHHVDLNFKFPLFGDWTKAFTVLDHAAHDEVKALLRSHGAKPASELA